MKPKINPKDQLVLQKISKKLPHGLLITAEDGFGLIDIAKNIANLHNSTAEIIQPEKDDKIDIERGSVSVEIIRELYDRLKTKNISSRVIIINYADKMTASAQNAFLKLLEEPGEGIHFILLANNDSSFLPTILSRVEKIKLNKITHQQSNELLDILDVKDSTKRSQLLFIASGLPDELTKLAQNESYFKNRSAIVRDARSLLQDSTYQKLKIIQTYKDNRPNTLLLLSDTANMLQNAILKNPQTNQLELSEKIIKSYQNIQSNGNIRLCLSQIIL